jgi:phosphoribosyl 1,2-cyclic phosphodiesterase
MRLQFVGCGDAFGSGGRFNTVVKNHLSLTTLEAHLSETNPKRLILTHMSHDMLARLPTLAHATAHDGMIVEF